jgi:methyl-accepting chemotaxis protein
LPPSCEDLVSMLLKLPLRVQLLTVIGAVVLGFAVFGVWSLHTIETLRVGGHTYQQIARGKDLVADTLPPPSYIIESYLVALQMARPDTESQRPALAERLRHLQEEYETRRAFWTKQSLPDAIARAFLDQAHAPVPRFYDIANHQLLSALDRNDRNAVDAALRALDSEYQLHRKAIESVVELANADNVRIEKDTAQLLDRSRIVLAVVFGLSLALGLALFLGVSRPLSRDIRTLTGWMTRLAKGDLGTLGSMERSDEIGEMATALETTRTSLAHLVGQIKHEVGHVAASATTLSGTAGAVAEGGHGQSDAASSMAAAVEQMSASIAEIGAVTSHVREVSRVLGTRSSEGREAMEQTAQRIRQVADRFAESANDVRRLSETGARISLVVNSIREIADQTNLLALNAAIEAARAGEQGRGFAVVADDVRKLAERTAKSTHQIGEMISEMHACTGKAVESITQGATSSLESVQRAEQAKLTLGESFSALGQLIAEIAHISDAMVEQRATSEQIARNVEQVAVVSERNNGATSDLAHTSRELNAMARSLETAVARFKD